MAHTKHGELTLDQLAEIQPGLARLMTEISDRYWILYYAARNANWRLARYQVNQLRRILDIGGLTRPHYKEPLSAFEQNCVVPLREAIEAEDFSLFEERYRRALDEANRLHAETGHPEIVWQLPPHPPAHLALR